MLTNTNKTLTVIRNSTLGVLTMFALTGFSGQQVLSEDAILAEQLSGGAAWVSLSASGDQALFVAGKDSNALYVNQGDGTFVDRARDYGIKRGYVRGDSILSDATDLNSDGCPDLYVRDFTTERDPTDHPSETHAIYLGKCNGTFTVLPGGAMDALSVAALDLGLAAQTRVTAASVSGDVVVLGTDAADFIRVTSLAGGVSVDVLKDGTMENVASFAGETERVVIFGGLGENFVAVDPTEEVSKIFETGPARAHDLLIEFYEIPRPELGGVGRDPSAHAARPASGTCCDVIFNGTSAGESYVGSLWQRYRIHARWQ